MKNLVVSYLLAFASMTTIFSKTFCPSLLIDFLTWYLIVGKIPLWCLHNFSKSINNLSFCSKALQDGVQSAPFKIYVVVISAYAGFQIIISLLMSVPCCRGFTNACYSWSFVRLAKWMHQVLSLFMRSDYLKAAFL